MLSKPLFLSIAGLGFLLVTMLFSVPTYAQQTALVVDEIKFVNHVDAGMVEQDAYIEKVPGSGEVFRVTADEAEKYLDFPAYKTVEPQHHDPFASTGAGPFKKGEAMGMTLREWLAGTGTAEYLCRKA